MRIFWLQLSNSKFLELLQIQPTSPMTSLGLVPRDAGLWDPRRLFLKKWRHVFIYVSLGGRQRWHAKNHPRGGFAKVWELTRSAGTRLMKPCHWRINSSDTNGGKTRLTWTFLPEPQIPIAALRHSPLRLYFFIHASTTFLSVRCKSLAQEELRSDCSIM